MAPAGIDGGDEAVHKASRPKSSSQVTLCWREADSNHRSPENADPVSRLTFSPLRHSRSVEETAHFRERDRWFESGSLHRGVRCEPDLLRPERDLAVLFVRAEIESSPQTQIEPSRFESLSRIALVAATPGIIDRRRCRIGTPRPALPRTGNRPQGPQPDAPRESTNLAKYQDSKR
jgi:hypothetical protein